MVIATRRQSKYSNEVRTYLAAVGHATNTEIATHVRQSHPSVSDTTIHRITQRLFHDGECVLGPVTESGAMRFDANLMPHDHFECQHCGGLRDIIVSETIRKELADELGGCQISGTLTILGNCHKCIIKEENNGSSKHNNK